MKKKLGLIGGHGFQLCTTSKSLLKTEEMKENSLGYSDEYQEYKKDYDKFEYDVITKDGKEYTNLYPNAGVFHSLHGDTNKLDRIDEREVSQIRFSNKPLSTLNYNVSQICKDEMKKQRDKDAMFSSQTNTYLYDIDTQMKQIKEYEGYANSLLSKKEREANIQPIRTEPKIQNNEPCSCGSGKKYKKCCKK